MEAQILLIIYIGGDGRDNMTDRVLEKHFINPYDKKVFVYKPINQYDKQHNFIKQWQNAKILIKEMDLIPSSLYRNLKKQRKTYRNFIFEYAEE